MVVQSVRRVSIVFAFSLAALLVALGQPASGQVGRSGIVATALDEKGQPIADLQLVVTPLGETSGRPQTMKTNKRGQAMNRFLTTGLYGLEVADTKAFFIRSARVEVQDSGGMMLTGYDINAHPERGLGTIPVQGGQQTVVDLVVVEGAERDRLLRALAIGEMRGDLEELFRLYKEEQNEEAVALAAVLMQQEPLLPEVVHIKGLAHARLGQLDEAEPLLRQAIEVGPDQTELRTSLGTFLLEKARAAKQSGQDPLPSYQEAEPLLRAASAGPGEVALSTIINHSIALEGVGRREEAVSLLRQALERDPSNLSTYFRLAAILRELGQPEEAMKVLAAMPQGDERAADVLYNIAVAYYNQQAYGEARDALRQALGAQPDHALAERLMGRVYFAEGKYAEAIPHLKRFLELEPGHPEAAEDREMLAFAEKSAKSSSRPRR